MSLLNKSKYREFVLEKTGELRAHKFSRLSPVFMREAEDALRAWTIRRVQSLPSIGKTIK